jgi:hypothetical protein
MFQILNHAKLIRDFLSLPKAATLREGDYSLTLTQQDRPLLALSLSIHCSPTPSMPTMPAHAPQADTRVRTLYTTSHFLRKCHTYFFHDSPTHERLLLISGICLDEETFVLDILVPVKLANASRYGVEADLGDLFAKLAVLEETHGLLQLAIFHSHLWEGRSAVQPSDTDQALQNNLEAEGYKTVQAIFSKDAHVGFFTTTTPFVLNVIGNDITEVETHAIQRVVQLNDVPHLSHQAI